MNRTIASPSSSAPWTTWRHASGEADVQAASEPSLRWDLLLACIAGQILTGVGRVHQLFPALGAVRPALLTGLAAIWLYLVDRHEQRRRDRLLLPTTKYLLALLCWMVLSLAGALVIGNSVGLLFGSFIKTVLLYLLVVGAVRGIGDVERLAFVYLLAATTYAGVALTRFDLAAGSDWKLDHLYYYDSNDLATFLVTAMPFGLYFLHSRRRVRFRVLAGLSLLLLSLAFVRTASRGGFIALVAVACFIVLFYSAISLRWRAGVFLLVATVVMATASQRYWEQMNTILSEVDYNRTDESGRVQIWSRGLGYMLQHPLLGVGPGNFPAAEGMLSPFAERQQFGVGVRWNAPHNVFVQVGAELGVVGLALFVALISSAFVAARRPRGDQRPAGAADGRLAELAQVLRASLVGFVVGGFFLSLAYGDMLYVLVGLAAGLRKVTIGAGAQAEAVREG